MGSAIDVTHRVGFIRSKFRTQYLEQVSLTGASATVDDLIVDVGYLRDDPDIDESANKLVKIALAFGPLENRCYNSAEFGILYHM